MGSYQTAWTSLHKLRSGLAALSVPILEGQDEIDETSIDHYQSYRNGRNGRGAGKIWVAIAIELRGRTVGQARLAVLPRARTAVPTSFVSGAIVLDATIIHTDAWA